MKKTSLAISLALAATFAVTPALTACSGKRLKAVSFPAQETKYAVESQGGSAVAYGNYVYFINGYRGYEDSDGKANVWGEVVKGGIYRVELNGNDVNKADPYKEGSTILSFEALPDSNGVEFKSYTQTTDYFDEPVNAVDVTLIAPKTAGTAGYGDGGLFIYDDYLYFASPNNEKNKNGVVQSMRTDFYMMPLKGGKPVLLYTTAEGVDTSQSAYAFYKYNDSVYLVLNEGSSLISIRINVAKEKTDDPVKYDIGASSFYFPVRDTYYNGIDTNTVEDFIYVVRPVKDGASEPRSGNVIEAWRPDGSEQAIVAMDGKTRTIVAVRDGVLFFRTTDPSGNDVIGYDNLHDALMQKSGSYAAAQNALADKDKNVQFSGQFATKLSSAMTSFYPFRSDRNAKSTIVNLAVTTNNGVFVYETNGRSRRVSDTSADIAFIANNYIYTGSGTEYYRAPLFENMYDYGETQTLASDATTATFSCDYAAGFFTYLGTIDQWASGYAFFYKVDGVEGTERQFVGVRASGDIPTDEQLEEAKGA